MQCVTPPIQTLHAREIDKAHLCRVLRCKLHESVPTLHLFLQLYSDILELLPCSDNDHQLLHTYIPLGDTAPFHLRSPLLHAGQLHGLMLEFVLPLVDRGGTNASTKR